MRDPIDSTRSAHFDDAATDANRILPNRAGRTARMLAALDRLMIGRGTVLVFIGTLVVALLMTLVVRPLLHREESLGGRGYDGYLELGMNLARGNGYVFEPGGHKVFHRPPLYPALLTPTAGLSEPMQRVYVAVLNSALFAGAAALVYLFSKALLDRATATLSWLIFVLNPPMLTAAKNAVSAICQAFTYTLALYVFYLLYRKAKAGEPLSMRFHAGVALALFAAIMTHGTMLAAAACLLAFLASWAVWARRVDVLRSAVLISVALALLVAPWTWRNYRVTGLFIPVAGNAGLAYFAGNAHWGITAPASGPDEPLYGAELRHAGLPTNTPEKTVEFYGFTSAESEKIANARMKEHLRTHPTAFARKVCLNAMEYYFPVIYRWVPPRGTLWSSIPFQQRFHDQRAFRDVALSLHGFVLLALAAGGGFILWQKGRRFTLVVLVLAWAAFALPYFPFLCFVGNQPYTFGTFPALAILSAAFLLRRHIKP